MRPHERPAHEKLAKYKLLVFGLNDKEIEAAKSEDGVHKARMGAAVLSPTGWSIAAGSSRGTTTARPPTN